MRLVVLGHRFGTVDMAKVRPIVLTFTAALTPHVTDYLVRHRMSLWREFFDDGDRRYYHALAQPHCTAIRQLTPDDVWDAIIAARPDLHSVLSRDDGRPWLRDQALEIQRALLQ